jgi:TolB-like protein/DNA-binding winged helix-turn-helix (wHTH) protein
MTDFRVRPGTWRFGVFEADLLAKELRKNGIKIHLQGQPFQILAVLLTRAGQLVSREELRREVWPEDTFVEFDHALNTAVKKIRFALGDDANAPRYVETISRHGYRFVGGVHPPADLTVPATSIAPAGGEEGAPSTWKLAGRTVVVLAIALVIALQLTHRGPAVHNQRVQPIVLAVLPFENWSDDGGLAHLTDGIGQELITQLGRMDPDKLRVAARTTVRQCQPTSKTVAQLGNELHADYLMAGSLRGDSQHVRVSAELVRVSDQVRVWGDDFDLVGGDLLTAERDLARSIGAKVNAIVAIGPASR